MINIGFYDSGIGGVSVLQEVLKKFKTGNIYYYMDNANCPLGEKTGGEVKKCVLRAVENLAKRCDLIVLACNTATAVCARCLREKFDLPIVGTEPAIKFAKGKTLLMMTPLTAQQNNVKTLIEAKNDCTFLFADCKNLATQVEENFFDLEKVALATNERFGEYKPFDSVVLGCTHYVFLRELLQEENPLVEFFDGNVGVANRVVQIAREKNFEDCLGEEDFKGKIYLYCSNDNNFISEKMKLNKILLDI